MIYQQEIKEIDSFYAKYKDKKIVFSKEVSQSLGLVQRETAIKLGNTIIKGAIISSTMDSLVIMAKLNEISKQTIYKLNGALTVQLKFISRENGKSLLFTIHTKMLNMNNQNPDQKDLQFISMQMRRKIPNDLIRIFGRYHVEARQKLISKKKKVECLLLANDEKTDCITESINKDELVLFLDDKSAVRLNQKAIAILKIVKTGEILEIIGTISKMIDESDGKYQVHLHYSMSDQSPRFGYSIHVLRNIINS